MKPAKLLSKLDRLSFPERQLALTQIARETKPPELRSLLESLNQDLFQAHCALTMACAVGDSGFLLKALAWDWPQARKRAATLLADFPTVPEGLIPATLSLDMTARQAFFRKIRRVRHENMAQRLIEPVLEKFGPTEACLLLPALSQDEFNLWLPRLAYRLESWRTPAGRHPDSVLNFMKTELERQGQPWRSEVWLRFSSAIEPLAQKRPDRLLSLALELGAPQRVWSLFGSSWGVLASREPELLLKLLLNDNYKAIWKNKGLPGAVLNRFRELGPETRVALTQPLAAYERHLERALSAVAPSQRKELFEGATAGLDLSQQLWSVSFMKVLPHAVRAQEAARMLSMTRVSSSLEATITRLGHQPPEEAKEQLQNLVRSPKVETRTQVREAMVVGAGLYRSAIEEILSGLASLQNEADPVRFAALQALSFWPYTCIEEKHLPHLRPVLKDVCEARDTSEATRRAFRRMALRWIELARVKSALFDFGLEVLSELSDACAALYLSSIRNFSQDRREAILQTVLPRVDKEMKAENFQPLFSLCASLGDRLWEHACIEERLEKMSRYKQQWQAQTAIQYWLYHPQERARRVQEVLRRDASAITISSVFETVNRRRQDLLDPYLRKKPTQGRFLSGKTIYLLPVHEGFHRWLPRQQKAFAETHALVFNDKARTLASRAQSIRKIGKLCFLSEAPVLAFLTHPELALREAALGTVTDADVLLERLNTQEARVAAFRLSRVVRDSRPEIATAIVERGLTLPNKLTSKKELYRLLGLLREPQLLAAAWREENQHRDLLVAVLHALQEVLDLSQARELYLEAFEADDPWIVRAALAVPRNKVPNQYRVAWVDQMRRLIKALKPSLSVMVWTTLRRWASEAPDQLAQTALEGLIDLDSVAWRDAVELLLACATPEGRQLAESAEGLVAKDSETRPHRDLPARQRLRHLVTRACAEDDDSTRARNLGQLATVRLPEAWTRFATRVPQEPWACLAQEVETFEEMEALIRVIKSEVSRPIWEPARVLEESRRLARESSPTARRLAVELLALAGAKTRWNEDCRTLLEQLRRDDYPGVAERAALLVTRPEP